MTDVHCTWTAFKKESWNHEVKKANALSSRLFFSLFFFFLWCKDVAGVPLIHRALGPHEENFSSKRKSYENEEK